MKTAGIGVLLARVVAQHYDEPRLKLAIYLLGVLLAFVGLGIILYGLKKGL